ncbi:MAG: oligosaccharide flippase family protein [Patescibacteria group bacterium]|nr:oligosaccharide flippase family protein [Patescibacteria group bacterium]
MEVETEIEIEAAMIKRRSLVGVVSLVTRSFFVQAVALASTFLLTVFLDPKTFGIFYLVSAFINFLTYFSDIGLAAALIQKKEKLEEKDLRTTFTIQQGLVLFLLTIIIIFSPWIKQLYGLSSEATFLLYSLALSFFFSSLKTIPSILLERNLKFGRLVVPQILETLTFNLLAVFLAWKGFGLSSFTWAVLGRGLVGLLAMYIISPWRIGFDFSKESLKTLLKFGLPYQANTIMAVIKDDLMTIFLGRIIGTAGLGYLGWGKKWAETPLRFLMDNVSKVAFPAFARMQDQKEDLQKAVEKAIFFLTFMTFPLLVGFSVLASDLVKIIPRYLKWEPALFALYLYSFNSAWATVSTSMTNLLNAVGKIKKTFKLMVMWMALTWALMPIMGIKFGYNGVAIASALIAVSSVVAIHYGRQLVKFDLVRPIFKPLLASLLMGILIFIFKPNFGNLFLMIFLRVIIGFFSYIIFSYLLIGPSLFLDIKKLYAEFRKKS